MLNPIHIWHDTPEGRKPFSLFVFGPYSAYSATPEWDVEIYTGHIAYGERTGRGHIGTVSCLDRDTHIVADIWDELDSLVSKVRS